MSKRIAVIPLSSVSRLSLVEAGGRSMMQVKEALGCQYILNAWFYELATGRPVGNLCIDGEVKARASWAGWGLTWDGTDIRMEVVPGDQAGRSYLSGVELLTPSRGPGAALHYDPAYGGSRGRSAVLLAGDNLILYCSGDGTEDGATPEWLRDELVETGKRYAAPETLRALGLDSGGSSQCDFDGIGKIYSSRRVAGYLCVWTDSQDKEDETMGKTVCLDPGHGPGNVNGSPDGEFREHEFCWDLSQRVGALLEAHGVHAIYTRTYDTVPSLTERAGVSNRAGTDCFVSIHTNAAGNDGWYDASGLEIYTSAGPEDAPRNVLAADLVNAFHAAGVSLRREPIKHQLYTVLVKTTAPAVLIEYGFHTSKEDVALLLDDGHIDKLAEATAKGICTYLGVEWKEDEMNDWENERDKAWQAAKEAGILDGTRPEDAVTRQELAVVLARLGLMD